MLLYVCTLCWDGMFPGDDDGVLTGEKEYWCPAVSDNDCFANKTSMSSASLIRSAAFCISPTSSAEPPSAFSFALKRSTCRIKIGSIEDLRNGALGPLLFKWAPTSSRGLALKVSMHDHALHSVRAKPHRCRSTYDCCLENPLQLGRKAEIFTFLCPCFDDCYATQSVTLLIIGIGFETFGRLETR